MKHLKTYLSFALTLAFCLSLAACGESNEDYGDDGSDYNLYGVPDSFEGLVKDSEQMSNLYLYGGAWKGENGGTLISATNDDGDEVRFALYDSDEEVTASGFIQFVPDYDYDYFYNEHDGVAYRSWFDEVGLLHVAELGTFTQMTGDAPGENIGDIDFETMAGTWYLDAEWDARSILVFDEIGGWELATATPPRWTAAPSSWPPRTPRRCISRFPSCMTRWPMNSPFSTTTRCAGATLNSIRKWRNARKIRRTIT